MKFRQWLRRSYKKEDGSKLTLPTVIKYDIQFRKLNKFVYRENGKNVSDYSVSEIKDLLARLQADKFFQEKDNSEIQARVLQLYITFRERNI